MAWNEPGKGQDPWGGGGRPPGDGPPDLDEIWRKFRERFGGKGGGGGGSGGSNLGSSGIILILLAALAVWLFSGFYTVDDAERAVVLQFGKYRSTEGPGLHWHVPRPIQKVEVVNIDAIRNVSDRSTMLTQDENIVDVDIGVQYKIGSAEDFLFNMREPETALHQALRSAVREVVGKAKMDFILTEGRSEVEARTREIVQQTVDTYASGLIVTAVNLKDAQPPEPVQDAFADAIRAREDKQRLINEAQAYANDVLPNARGNAARQIADAEAYRERVIARSEGEAERFNLLREEYEQAPQVTRKRLYLETMETVLANSSKVIVDDEAGNQMLYLPLDQLIKGRTGQSYDSSSSNISPNSSSSGSDSSQGSRLQDLRSRGRSR